MANKSEALQDANSFNPLDSLTNKLIRLGWIDGKGRSLPWHYWKEKGHRTPVAYLSGEHRPNPIYVLHQGAKPHNEHTTTSHKDRSFGNSHKGH